MMSKDYHDAAFGVDIEFCPNCGVQAMITYRSQGKILCAICGTEIDLIPR